MIDAEETLPEVVRGSQVSAAAAENKEKLGLEWLPILQVLVSAPAVLLLLRELGKIVNGKLNAPTKIKLRRTVAKGQTEELQLDTTTLTSEDTRALVDRFFGKR
ncbi:MAG: hypothetical protein JWM58_3995 [Rhizobium sp.]|nr:hypothetical protein [Rhizobium sp.]